MADLIDNTKPAIATIPEHLCKRLEEEEAKSSLTMEEWDAKHAAVEECKKKLETEHIQKVREDLEHAKEVADRIKAEAMEKDAQLDVLRAKMADVEKRKEEIEKQRIGRIEHHHHQVDKMRMVEEEIQEHTKELKEKLAATEERCKAIEEEKIRKAHVEVHRKSENSDELLGKKIEEKLAATENRHMSLDKEKMHKIEECLQKVELNERPGPTISKEDVDAKLAAAEACRKEAEHERLEKLQEKEKYANEVRKCGAENAPQDADTDKTMAI
ncbi:hypothetical protein BC938DRAFT_482177 [Jimgerdemannia flammicorona]|uniref:Uncharacterized protein n=1 Tax=Jimgerdemannia flammicorona TaxID=994334 RepID=A0A433QEN9_9FUNG|nr:hypothetical protein BC938DRAFT_482177 [Jimgerdemannia flammicorona]